MQQDTNGNIEQGATVVITHRVSLAQQVAYEAWLNEIGPVCKASRGLLDWHIIRPIAGLTDSYTVIIRYDTQQNLKLWMESQDRKQLIHKIDKLLSGEEKVHINSGLDFLFTQASAKPATPVKWKQFLITWSAIFPLVVCTPFILLPALNRLAIPRNALFDTLLITAFIVFMMVYVVMPRYTKLVRAWLFK
jgi:antibiotic biosynthesis monooxygenase (ABM) superfamily enzyme